MTHRKTIQRAALSAALTLCLAGVAHAQSTTGSIYGTVPSAEAGTTVQVTNNAGFSRTVTVGADGRYSISSLPIGDYKINVQRDGQVIGTRDVSVIVGAGTDASFASSGAGASTLETVNVTATAAAAIDLTAVDTRTVITAEQLKRLPIGRTAEAIAMLAPGAVGGAGGYAALANLVSFGGAGASENAYYINGYFTGEPLSNLGGSGLPFVAVAQQETYTGGYSAKYGRSDGGVINQVGKSGTNEWEFGAQIDWAPKSLRSRRDDLYLPDIDLSQYNSNPNLPSTCGTNKDEKCEWGYSDPDLAGTKYQSGKGVEFGSTRYSGYVGGPIIQDKLFFFAGGEWYKTDSVTNPNTLGNARSVHAEDDNSKYYVKINWNINDNNLLEATWFQQNDDYSGNYRAYDLDTFTQGAKLSTVPTPIIKETDYRVLKYTSFLTDNLTLNATYGTSDFTNRQVNPSILANTPYIAGSAFQDPAANGGKEVKNIQGGYQSIDAKDKTRGLRADLEWVVGDHTLSVGVDNIKFEAKNEGTSQVADYWEYRKASSGSTNISPSLGVGAPGGEGYYVRQLKYFNNTSMSLDQKAWYLEDRWKVTENLLLSIGLRNDEFTNKNDAGQSYMDAKDQWAPRLGFSWDVMGDASLKVFGNAGRYFLAMPNNVAIRGASASTYTYQYYTYSGVDASGLPTGLVEVPGLNGAPAPGPVSSNGEYGVPVDVLAFAPKDMKNMYQDEYILGFEKTWGSDWVYGAKFTYRDLKSSIDDICDSGKIVDKLIANKIDPDSVEVASCYMFNPGGSNTFSLKNVNGSGRTEIKMNGSDWGFDEGVKRTYKAIDLYLEHPFDGKWEGRVNYTYSKSEGNNEGQVKSEFGQTNISKTQDWDAAEMMRFANGYLANDRRHQLKLFGSYAITPEWMVGGNIRVMSGSPISCLGYYNPDGGINEGTTAGDPIGYGAAYHTCLGSIAKPGARRNPWTKNVDLAVTYRPSYFDEKVTFSMQVFNVLNEQKATQVDVTSEEDAYTVSNTYMVPIARQTPRYVMFSATYDF
ncbi:MAG: Oar protein [Stenotrophomonas sp.]|jgi:hypothetical protein|nr:MAG: Oar protein [Stenotrophomonas sp.]